MMAAINMSLLTELMRSIGRPIAVSPFRAFAVSPIRCFTTLGCCFFPVLGLHRAFNRNAERFQRTTLRARERSQRMGETANGRMGDIRGSDLCLGSGAGSCRSGKAGTFGPFTMLRISSVGATYL